MVNDSPVSQVTILYIGELSQNSNNSAKQLISKIVNNFNLPVLLKSPNDFEKPEMIIS